MKSNSHRTRRKTHPRPSSHKSVDGLVDELDVADDVKSDFHGKVERTKIVRSLINARVQAGYTQAAFAKEVGCTQSRISKLESSEDSSLSIADLSTYALVTGQSFALEVGKSPTLAQRVRFHFTRMKFYLEQIGTLTDKHQDDPDFNRKAKDFLGEASFNLGTLLIDTVAKCDLQESKGPAEPDLVFFDSPETPNDRNECMA